MLNTSDGGGTLDNLVVFAKNSLAMLINGWWKLNWITE